jgi:uncharacterized protein YigE (DUF2233 family)
MTVVSLVALVLTAAPPAAPQQAGPAWKPLAPGAEHLRVEAGAIDLFRFDLEAFRAEVAVPGAGKPATALELRRQAGAVLVVNGGFFDTDGRPLGLRIADGRKVIGLRAVVDWGVLVLRPGRAAIVHSRDYATAAAAPPPVTGAIQVGPRIVIGGQVPGLKPQAARRTAVALEPDGRRLTVVVANARLQAADLGRTLAGLGFKDALMLDGGPSTQLSAAIGDFTRELPGGYAVPDALVIRRR